MVVFGERGAQEERRAARASVKINFIGEGDFDGRLPCLSKFFPFEAAPEAQIIHEIVKEPKDGIVFAPPTPPKTSVPP
jgi:hypothetical protein